MTQDLPSMVALRRLKAEAGLTTEAVLGGARSRDRSPASKAP